MSLQWTSSITKSLILIALNFLLSPAMAQIFCVPDDFPTIQSAVDATTDGCRIIISPGTYYENIKLKGANIILQSVNPDDPESAASTIIDGGNTKSVIKFNGDELTTCALVGFTIRNGRADCGGGIDGGGCLAAIKNCIIENNTAQTSGGGLFNCHGLLARNFIANNTSQRYGGALGYCGGDIRCNIIAGNQSQQGGALFQCFGVIQNNFICQNISQETGGAAASSSGIFRNNLIAKNISFDSGGALASCSGVLLNNTIADNQAARGSALFGCRGFIVNNIIWRNQGAEKPLQDSSQPLYSCIQEWTNIGRGNISKDPLFQAPHDSDYRLRSSSPCINAGSIYYLFGDYLAALDGSCRLYGASVDMGAYEWGATSDKDGDIFSDDAELRAGTNPDVADSDGDGLSDGAEVLRGASPLASDVAGTTTIPIDFISIQQAIFFAYPHETMIIRPGEYHENIHLLDKNITLRSANSANPRIVRSTVINGGGRGAVISLAGGEDSSCLIDGLTIRNGFAWHGAGINGNGASPTLRNNRIIDNCASGAYASGGGIQGCHGAIIGNLIMGNRAEGEGASGGGLAICRGDIRRNQIIGNHANRHGGGLVLCGANGAISCNTIAENTSLYGGALSSCYSRIINNIIHSNNARKWGGAIHGGGFLIANNTIFGNSANEEGGGLTSCGGAIKNNILWDNRAPLSPQIALAGELECAVPDHSCIMGWTQSGGGNLSNDPQFINPEAYDFHLRPTSPCLDAAERIPSISDDYDGRARPRIVIQWENRADGSGYDIGALEYCPAPPRIAEFNFSRGLEGWSGGGAPEVFALPTFGWKDGALFISFAGNKNVYGFWESPQEGIPLEPNYLYRAVFRISTDIADRSRVPAIRLRTLSANAQRSDLVEIASIGDGGFSPTAVPADYELYILPSKDLASPNGAARIRLFMDIINFDETDAASGAVFLHQAIVERIEPSDMVPLGRLKNWTFAGVEDGGWTWNEIPEIFTPPEHGVRDGLFMRGRDANTYGFWMAPPDSLVPRRGVIYRASFVISSSVVDLSKVPGMRLRCNASTFQSAGVLEISSAGNGENSPAPYGATFDLYYAAPPDFANRPANRLLLFFDMKSLNPDDELTGELKLEQVSVDAFGVAY